MSAASDRRKLVNASVVAGSAVMFAAAWAGVVRADQGAVARPAVAAVVKAPPNLAGSGATDATAAPTPTRRVIVVRQSRAS